MSQSDTLAAQSHIALDDRIRQRAYQIWEAHGQNGEETSLQDWLEAEREVLGNRSESDAQNRATVVGPAFATHAPYSEDVFDEA